MSDQTSEVKEEIMKHNLIGVKENELFDASKKGDTNALKELIEEDNLTLARLSVTWYDETPLHIAAMLGHEDLTSLLLSHKSDMAIELNLKGQTPLHLAAASGHVKIVKQLLVANHVGFDACNVRDEDGRTPLHLAVMKGKVEIVKELIQARPELHQYTSDKGQTILHFAVKYNRLEALKILIELGIDHSDDIVNVKDREDHGNTVLHRATYLKQVEIVKYLLLRTPMKVNVVNGHNHTALHITEHVTRDIKSMEIRECLLNAGALKFGSLHEITSLDSIVALPSNITSAPPVIQPSSQEKGKKKKVKKKNEDRLKKTLESLMISATVIAAMAYQAAMNPPGGVWDYEGAKAQNNTSLVGTSIMASTKPDFSSSFWVCNAVSFIASLSIIFLLISGLPLKRRCVMWILKTVMWIAISTMALTYVFSLGSISPDRTSYNFDEHGRPYLTIYGMAGWSVLAWVFLECIVFLVHIIRFGIWVLKKVGRFIIKVLKKVGRCLTGKKRRRGEDQYSSSV